MKKLITRFPRFDSSTGGRRFAVVRRWIGLASSPLKLFVLLLATIVLTACWDFNKTVENDCPVSPSSLCQRVRVKGAGDRFPIEDVSEWYNSNAPTRIERTIARDEFILYWDQDVPQGDSLHVGAELSRDWEVEDLGGRFRPRSPAPLEGQVCEVAPGVTMRPRVDPQRGLVMDVFNADPTAQASITVAALEWTASLGRVPLANLVWGDPVLEALPWERVTTLPFTIQPGDPPRTFDIPDERLAGRSWGLGRMKFTTSAGFHQEPVYQVRLTQAIPIPTLSEWGLIILALLLLSVGTVFIVKSPLVEFAGGTGTGAQDFKGRVLLLWAPAVFRRVVIGAVVMALVGLAGAIWALGTVSAVDVAGTMISTVIVSYWVHLLILSRSKLN